ncbi:uncharacterized protein BDW47DRAFT_53833 [Aspergillus candidus]|uniref:Dolichol-phosphate mannosyltransferase n=1 Tax=Aspergillus candidus TaxID=41067 RepID=A0A2I2F6C3_ASPCN|nr:dolichol-phosphate mannosyltransferase [Aspergillus candidus]PLB36189.1 dolichol-phosphate mannosyltransferase [Aspergillus candidus]
MAKSHPGVLHEYAPRLTAFEFTSQTTNDKPNALLFVGGLTDGLLTVPYVEKLAQALEPTPWTIYNVLLTSSYHGWGVGSLDQDINEIAQCVDFVRGRLPANSKIVLMGHSTGSQDVLHYLYKENPTSGGEARERPALDGAIMQAPMSDREMLIATTKGSHESHAALSQLVHFARTRSTTEIMPLNLTAAVGMPADTPINAYRFWSLASPESPETPAEDDLFSSDLTDQRLKETFGVVGERGLLRGKLMALYSGKDEYGAPGLDMEGMLRRWKEATAGKWDEGSGIIPGATHNVQDEGQEWLAERVTGYLGRV